MSTDTPETGTTEPTTETTPEKPETGNDLAAELDKWKAQARKNEERAKANAAAAKELEQFKQQSMSDQEKAIEEARKAARSEVLAEVGAARVGDAIRVALAGRPVDVDALLDGVNPAKYLDDDGQPDRAAIAAWVDRIAPAPAEPEEPSHRPLDLGQGSRPSTAVALNGDPLLADLKSKLGVR